eukprot:351971-Chlamydomonas_euryale.AAC.6
MQTGVLGARVRDLPGDPATIGKAIRAREPRTWERAFRSCAGLVSGGPVTIGFPLVCGARVRRPCNHRRGHQSPRAKDVGKGFPLVCGTCREAL